MTETSGKDIGLISPDANAAYGDLNYAGMGDQAEILFGPECEFFVCKIEDGELAPITCDEAKNFITLFEGQTGGKLHQEVIASHFELNTGPMNLDNFSEVFEDYFNSVRDLYRIADEQGYRVVPSSHAPHIKGVEEIIDQLVDRERMQQMIPEAQKYLGDNVVKFANLTAGIHVSSGYKDTAQFYDDLRRSYYLSPFIYAISNNGFPFWQGMEPTDGASPRLAMIEEFASDPQGRTGIDPLFYNASDGEDFLKKYIDRTMNAPLFCYRKKELTFSEIFNFETLKNALKFKFNVEPRLRKTDELGATPETPLSFSDLVAFGLNTISNLQFAASAWWYGVKVQSIPGLDGKNGFPLMRIEDRVWNAGTWQLSSALLTRALMTLEPECGAEVDDLLAEFGFHPDGPAHHVKTTNRLKAATEAAWKNAGQLGLDFEYGNGMALDFGQRFVGILQKYAKKHGLDHYLAPMEYIARTNNTDARVLAHICETPEDVVNLIKNYDVKTLPNSKESFGMLLDKGKLPNPAAKRKLIPTPLQMQYL